MKTFMEDEIYSEIDVIKKIKNVYLKNGKIDFPNIEFNEIKFIASGSSYNDIRLAHKFFENYTEKIATFEYASEFISNQDKKISKDTLYCFVSQSGETYDTKYALNIVKNHGGKTLSFVNNSNSSIYNLADYKVDILAGCENSIAATKSFLGGFICLFLFSLSYSNKKYNAIEMLNESIEAINNIFQDISNIKKISKILSKKKKISIIGYHYGYILAKELALKIKETSYIDTTAYPTGEFLHGHSAILNKNKTLIEIFTSDAGEFEENTLNKIKKDFNPNIIAITDKKTELKNSIWFKKYKYEISKICAITVILQLLSLYTALNLNVDVDKPKGLNKVVNQR